MATRAVPIFGPDLLLDATGNVFFEPYSVKATNGFWKHTVLVFNDSGTKISIYGSFRVPGDYVGSPQINIPWTSTVTSGNGVWDFDYRAVGGDNTESLDQATAQESVTVTDAAPSAAHNLLQTFVSPTAANFTAGKIVEFKFSRDGADGADTLGAAMLLFFAEVEFQYSDA